jgi:hypothetical protein
MVASDSLFLLEEIIRAATTPVKKKENLHAGR